MRAGHHEAEFGMSWCAGFSSEFWKGYHSVLPKDPGAVLATCPYISHMHWLGRAAPPACPGDLTADAR